jgi:hypothetical protein
VYYLSAKESPIGKKYKFNTIIKLGKYIGKHIENGYTYVYFKNDENERITMEPYFQAYPFCRVGLKSNAVHFIEVISVNHPTLLGQPDKKFMDMLDKQEKENQENQRDEENQSDKEKKRFLSDEIPWYDIYSEHIQPGDPIQTYYENHVVIGRHRDFAKMLLSGKDTYLQPMDNGTPDPLYTFDVKYEKQMDGLITSELTNVNAEIEKLKLEADKLKLEAEKLAPEIDALKSDVDALQIKFKDDPEFYEPFNTKRSVLRVKRTDLGVNQNKLASLNRSIEGLENRIAGLQNVLINDNNPSSKPMSTDPTNKPHAFLKFPELSNSNMTAMLLCFPSYALSCEDNIRDIIDRYNQNGNTIRKSDLSIYNFLINTSPKPVYLQNFVGWVQHSDYVTLFFYNYEKDEAIDVLCKINCTVDDSDPNKFRIDSWYKLDNKNDEISDVNTAWVSLENPSHSLDTDRNPDNLLYLIKNIYWRPHKKIPTNGIGYTQF